MKTKSEHSGVFNPEVAFEKISVGSNLLGKNLKLVELS